MATLHRRRAPGKPRRCNRGERARPRPRKLPTVSRLHLRSARRSNREASHGRAVVEPSLPTPRHDLAPAPPSLTVTRRRAAAAAAERLRHGEIHRWRTLRDALQGHMADDCWGPLPEPLEQEPTPGLNHHVGIPGARLYKGHSGNP